MHLGQQPRPGSSEAERVDLLVLRGTGERGIIDSSLRRSPLFWEIRQRTGVPERRNSRRLALHDLERNMLPDRPWQRFADVAEKNGNGPSAQLSRIQVDAAQARRADAAVVDVVGSKHGQFAGQADAEVPAGRVFFSLKRDVFSSSARVNT